jgi:MoaA/NifB/PqqE/SkfB family radical SAM enzyme
MENIIRKISIGRDYKNDAMHYAVGQEVYGGHVINCIISDDEGQYIIYIEKSGNVLPWKKFNAAMAISIEYDLEYSSLKNIKRKYL